MTGVTQAAGETSGDIHRVFTDVEGVPSPRAAVEFLRRADAMPAVVAYRERLRVHLAPAAGETVLDVGCGLGTHAAAIAAARGGAGPVVGVDRPAMIAQAREVHGDDAGVRWLEGAAEAIPLDDDTVDAVLVERVLMYTADAAAVIAEIARVLRPGGRVALFELDYASMVLGGGAAAADAALAIVCESVVDDRMGRRLGRLLAAVGLEVTEQITTALPMAAPVFASVVRGPVDEAVAAGRLDGDAMAAWYAEQDAPGAYPGTATGVLACAVRP